MLSEDLGEIIQLETGSFAAYDIMLYENAKDLWLCGDWRNLALIDAGHACDERVRGWLLLLVATAYFQMGCHDKGRDLLLKAKALGVSECKIKKMLLSGVFNCIALANVCASKNSKAEEYFGKAIAVFSGVKDLSRSAEVRRLFQLRGVEGPDSMERQMRSASRSKARYYDSTAGMNEALKRIHEIVAPTNYLQFGVGPGNSFLIAHCPSLGVDPLVSTIRDLRSDAELVTETNDDFFRFSAKKKLTFRPELILINSVAVASQVLTTLCSLQSYISCDALVVISRVLPENPKAASCWSPGVAWCGDGWRLPALLRKLEPKVTQLLVDAPGGGLLLLKGLGADSKISVSVFEELISECEGFDHSESEIIQNRKSSVDIASQKFELYL